MSPSDREDNTIYQVVTNDKEQYSIWPADQDLPMDWKAVGKKGLKGECLAYINEAWADLHPRSQRGRM